MDCINRFYCYKKRKKLKQKKNIPHHLTAGFPNSIAVLFKLNTDERLILALQNFKTS